MRMLRRVAAGMLIFALCALASFPGSARAQDVEWKGHSSLDFVGPPQDKPNTLRVLRFQEDLTGAADDQGSVVGWSNRAATGTLKPRDEPQETESIEIIQRGQSATK